MKHEQRILESNILIALFKATVEQSAFLTNEFNHKPKQVFNIWQKHGDMLLDQLEKTNVVNQQYIEALTDVIHNIIQGIRDENVKNLNK